MIQNLPDAAWAVLLLLLAGTSVVAYAVRVALYGPAHYGRVDALGGSVLLAKPLLSWGYWTLQPVKRLCLVAGVSANAVTWFSLVLGLLSATAIANGAFGFGAFLGIVAALCDGIDGMIARERGEASKSGALLDAATDRYVESMFLGAVVLHYLEHRAVVVLTLLAWVGSYMISYGSAKAEGFGVPAPRGLMRRHERSVYLLGGALLSSWTIPTLERALPLDVPRGIPLLLAIGVVALFANVSAVQRLLTIAAATGLTRTASRPVPTKIDAPRLSEPSTAARSSVA